MSVKRPGSPLESMALVPRVEEGAAAAASSEFDKLPDEIITLIFSFLPKKDCKAVSLVDKRLNILMTDHYAKRAMEALKHGFTVMLPNFFQSLATEGVTLPIGHNMSVTAKLQFMQRQDHRVRKAIHEVSVESLVSFIEDSSIKGLAGVHAALSHQLPEMILTPVHVTDLSTNQTLPLTTEDQRLPVKVRPVNTSIFMQ